MKQDISKVIITPQGSDPGSSQYGSKLFTVLGKPFDFALLQSLVAKSVAESIRYLQNLQYIQSTKQDLSYQETIGSIDSVNVTRGTGLGGLNVRLLVTSVGGLREIYAIQLGD